MKSEIILDTGPLIALLNSRDPHHRWAMEHWDWIEPPLLTCEAVVSEACFLARCLVNHGPERVLEFVRRGVLDLTFPLADEIDALVRLVRRERIPLLYPDLTAGGTIAVDQR